MSMIDDLIDEKSKLQSERDRLKAECSQHINKVRIEIGRRTLAESHAEKLAEELRKCLRWMRPIIDGLSIPSKQKNGEPSVRTAVLDTADKALAAFDQEIR